MLKHNNATGRSAIVASILTVVSLVLFALPAAAKNAPPSGPKLFSVTLATEPDATTPATDDIRFTLTITNLPSSTAVLGSANVTIPSGLTGVSGVTVSAISPGRTWSATKVGDVIRLRASSDKQKLTAGQFVSVRFTATPTGTAGTYPFLVQAKSSRDFSGSPFFTRVGFDPVIVVCPNSSDPCTGTLGNTSDAQPDSESGSVTLEDGCFGCVLIVNQTAGNFCSTGSLPADCRAPFEIQFNTYPLYSGNATVVVTCDVSDCPVIVGCSDCSSTASVDHYDVYFTESDSNTGEPDVQNLSSCAYSIVPCIDSEGRVFGEGGGSNDFRSIVKLGNGEPRIGHG